MEPGFEHKPYGQTTEREKKEGGQGHQKGRQPEKAREGDFILTLSISNELLRKNPLV